MATEHTTALPDHQQQLTDRLLEEGTLPLVEAAKAAGIRQVHLRTLMRAAISRKLEALKFAGRWVTSPSAVRRWIARQQQRIVAAQPAKLAEPSCVLDRYGLGREAVQ